MAQTITCPVCGQVNSAEALVCQNCRSPLKPVTGPVQAGNEPIQPGAAPTSTGTGEPEPALPKWLRDAREQARQALKAESEKNVPDEQTPQQPAQEPEAPDLLAGLESQKQAADDDTPEWVARIAGRPSKQDRPEPQMAKYVELNDEDETPAQQVSEEPAPKPASPPRPETPQKPPERDELGEWFREAASQTRPRRESATGQSKPTETAPLKTGSEDSPSWLKGLEPQSGTDPTGSSWKSEMPLPSSAPATPTTPELPTWLKNLGAEPKQAEPSSSEDQLPAWLKTSRTADDRLAAPASSPAAAEAVPDWISTLRSVGGDASGTGEGAGADRGSKAAVPEPDTGAPAFSADVLSTRDVDAIFASMQTPDWLLDATRGKTPAPDVVPPAAQEQPMIAPAELPSWVQAMRPVESELPPAPPPPVEGRIEEGGPLDGLQGVLPGIPGASAATSKPQALSERLEANEQHRTHAELLEKMLAAEVTPIPMKAVALVGSQRGLRWAITALLLFVLGVTVISGSQIFAFPSAVPTESLQAVQAIGSIPAGAPVLVVFDYEPATVGEMEASGASLMDHLLLLQHPQLALVSTSPTGAALAERFMSMTLADRKYEIGTQYVNLGYLPGGLAGVRDFAQSPLTTMPLGENASQVWSSNVLQQVRALSDFAGIIVLTDSAESGRVWIEQTAGLRGSGPMVIVSSAQAGPMLLPYVDSGQVNGLVAGVYGAVGPEATNGGLPGFVRRYWDAYNLGLYLAAFLIVAGGLWNLWRGMQDRQPRRVG